MNFLSHFYFERFAIHSQRLVGALLPDLLKNVDKSYTFHPQKSEEILFANPKTRQISEGWYRHVEVDKLFHGSEFFLEHCHQLRLQLQKPLAGLPIRPSFMAHIAIELLLDHLLIEQELVNVSRLYEHLEHADRNSIRSYLKTIAVPDIEAFMKFYEDFISWKYIFEYKDINAISKPLFNIAKRIWQFETNADQRMELTQVLIDYKAKELQNFKVIYAYIQDNMTYLS
ncbi:hypothetical protein ACFRAE_03565 [Sphingobacterium sp. HJSM2_6]|uniref:hypothetical protein n=1 Tax=Sphingobacterium sp. HJSM2_6 TaxID=3366264 RepID=UPI003BEE5FEE